MYCSTLCLIGFLFRIVGKVIPQKINNERDLYRVYAKSMKDVPTVINVDIDITFLEALSKFKVNFTIDDFMVLNVTQHEFSPFRLLEEAVERATWLVCVGVNKKKESGNLLDFMIRWLKSARSVHDNFRLWIICEGIDALTLSSVQKCSSHYLGHEPPEDRLKGETKITAFTEANERLMDLANKDDRRPPRKKKYKSELKDVLLHSLQKIALH